MNYFLLVLLTILIRQVVQTDITQKNMTIKIGVNSCPDLIPIVIPERISTMKDKIEIIINDFFIFAPFVIDKYNT